MKTLLQKNRLGISLTVLLTITVFGSAFTAADCFKSSKVQATDIAQVENKLNQGANALNAAAKTNRELYRTNVINKPERQRVAGIINKANAGLGKVTDRIYEINPNNLESIELGRTEAIKLVNDVIGDLRSLGVIDPKLKLAIESVITLLNESITLINRVKVEVGGDGR